MGNVMKLPKRLSYYMRSITGGVEGLGKRLLKARRKTTSFAINDSDWSSQHSCPDPSSFPCNSLVPRLFLVEEMSLGTRLPMQRV